MNYGNIAGAVIPKIHYQGLGLVLVAAQAREGSKPCMGLPIRDNSALQGPPTV